MPHPKRRENDSRRVVDPRDYAPEGWNDLTPEQMDEMDRDAENTHEKLMDSPDSVNLMNKSTWTQPPF